MAQHFIHDNHHRKSNIIMPTNNQIAKDSYDYELKKLMERERQLLVAQVWIFY